MADDTGIDIILSAPVISSGYRATNCESMLHDGYGRHLACRRELTRGRNNDRQIPSDIRLSAPLFTGAGGVERCVQRGERQIRARVLRLYVVDGRRDDSEEAPERARRRRHVLLVNFAVFDPPAVSLYVTSMHCGA